MKKVKKWKVVLYVFHMISIMMVCVFTIHGDINHAQASNLFLIMNIFVSLLWWL